MQTQQTLTRAEVVGAMQSKYRRYQNIMERVTADPAYPGNEGKYMACVWVLDALDQIALDLGIDPDELSDPKYSE